MTTDSDQSPAATYRERIVGSWESTETRRTWLFFTLHVTLRKTYAADGTWVMTNLIHETGESNVRWTGSWDILGNQLLERLGSSNVPTRSPMGTLIEGRIRRLDSRILELTNTDGSEPQLWRRTG